MSRIFIFQHNQLIGQIQVQLTSTTSTIKYHLNNQHVVSETVMIICSECLKTSCFFNKFFLQTVLNTAPFY